jgi:hypothetical protein
VLKYKNDRKKQVLFSLFGKRIPEISSEKLWRMTLRDHEENVLRRKDKYIAGLFSNFIR